MNKYLQARGSVTIGTSKVFILLTLVVDLGGGRGYFKANTINFCYFDTLIFGEKLDPFELNFMCNPRGPLDPTLAGIKIDTTMFTIASASGQPEAQ